MLNHNDTWHNFSSWFQGKISAFAMRMQFCSGGISLPFKMLQIASWQLSSINPVPLRWFGTFWKIMFDFKTIPSQVPKRASWRRKRRRGWMVECFLHAWPIADWKAASLTWCGNAPCREREKERWARNAAGWPIRICRSSIEGFWLRLIFHAKLCRISFYLLDKYESRKQNLDLRQTFRSPPPAQDAFQSSD